MDHKIKNILDNLFEIHLFYKSNKKTKLRNKIIRKCEPLFIQLEKLGVSRSFSSTFLVFGDRFLISEFGYNWEQLRRLKNVVDIITRL